MGGTALGASGRSNNGLKLDVKTGKLNLWRLFPTFTFTFTYLLPPSCRCRLLDSDSYLYQDPYKYLTVPPFSNITWMSLQDLSGGVNGGDTACHAGLCQRTLCFAV